MTTDDSDPQIGWWTGSGHIINMIVNGVRPLDVAKRTFQKPEV